MEELKGEEEEFEVDMLLREFQSSGWTVVFGVDGREGDWSNRD